MSGEEDRQPNTAAPAPPGAAPRPFYCGECGHSTRFITSHARHIARHITKQPFSFICEICGDKFSQKCLLLVHIRKHTGERTFSCHICSKKFSQKGNLTVHIRKHNGERPFRCHKCCYAAAHSSHLTRHLLRHEKKGE